MGPPLLTDGRERAASKVTDALHFRIPVRIWAGTPEWGRKGKICICWLLLHPVFHWSKLTPRGTYGKIPPVLLLYSHTLPHSQ